MYGTCTRAWRVQARFFFSIAHGCIPVRYDGWRRHLRPLDAPTPPTPTGMGAGGAGAAYPFAHRIDWRRLVVEAPDSADGALLDALLAMPPEEVEGRRAYLRRVTPWLLYGGDAPRHGDDAAQLLIEQLERRYVRSTAREAG